MSQPDAGMYWLLIAVLSSTMPLSPEVAQRLYQAAYRLQKTRENVEKIQGELVQGRVVRLHKDLVLGTVTGPAFEAEIATERGDGTVRFLLTRQGLGEDDDDVPAPGPPRMLN